MIIDKQTIRICTTISKKFGLKKCKECAAAIAKELSKSNISGEILELSAQSSRGWIVMADEKFKIPFSTPPGGVISDTGKHYGVKVNELVFCNIFRNGIKASAWAKEFTCDSGKISCKSYKKF